MFKEFWEDALKGLRESGYWPALQPIFLTGIAGGAAVWGAFQFVQWQYGYSPAFLSFLTSYVALRIYLGCAVIAASWYLILLTGSRKKDEKPWRWKQYLARHRRTILWRSAGFLLIAIGAIAVFRALSPGRVNHIRIQFLDDGRAFNRRTFTYLVYELNRRQRHWFFEIEFTTFDEGSLTSGEADRCANSAERMLCYAQTAAEGTPLIAITSESLEPSNYWQHIRNVSVITTHDHELCKPVGIYDYLMYSVVLQSILIHLDVGGGGLPQGAFGITSISRGGVFEYSPRPDALTGKMLASRLSPAEEQLLFNRFGAEYVSVCTSLLSLDWLREERVQRNVGMLTGR
jgi:hypothetical protein